MKLSIAQHERYGQHLSQAEVEALVAPRPDALAAVDGWLQSHGIDLEADVSRSPAQDWVTVRARAAFREGIP
jgi:tripeptidyl-peptidase-1